MEQRPLRDRMIEAAAYGAYYALCVVVAATIFWWAFMRDDGSRGSGCREDPWTGQESPECVYGPEMNGAPDPAFEPDPYDPGIYYP